MTETLTLVEPQKTVSVEQRVANGIAAFEQKRSDLTTLAAKYKGLKITDYKDNKQIKAVSAARIELKKERCAVENDAKDIRKHVKSVADKVTVLEKELVAIVSPVEDELQEEENKAEAEKERVRLEEEAKETARINAMVKMLIDNGCQFDGTHYTIGELTISHAHVRVIEVPAFAEFVDKVKAENDKIVAAENERLRIEAEAKEAERLRIEAEQEQLRKDREELERLRAESEAIRLANEKEAKRLQEEKEAQEAAKVEAERQRIEAIVAGRVNEIKALGLIEYSGHFQHPQFPKTGIDKETFANTDDAGFEEIISIIKQRIEEGKEAAEKKRLADLEAVKEQARKYEAARIEAENKRIADEAEAARIEAERLAALAPDKEKLLLFSDTIGKLEVPEMSTEAAKEIALQVKVLIGKIQSHILTKTKAL